MSSESLEEHKLIERVLHKDDPRAFQALYQKYAPSILRRAYRLTNDKSLAEDALQQVFLEMHRSLADFRGEGTLSSWLHRIAERVILQFFRKQWKSRSIKERFRSYKTVVLEKTTISQETEVAQNELQLWIREFVEKLPPDQRMVLLLCDLEDFSTDEAAEKLKIPRGTVASRLHHARKKLKKMIEASLQRQELSWHEVLGSSLVCFYYTL